MDPSLRKEKEAFKKRLLAETEKKQKSREAASKGKSSVPSAPSKKAKKKVYTNAENFDQIRLAAQSAHRSNNQNLILKSIMDMMKERYVNKNYEKISLDEIISAIELTDLKPDMRQWIQGALASNPKIQFYPDEGKYLFKPALGHNVCSRKQLLTRLREHELKGLGGILVSDIKEAVHNYERVIKRLIEDEHIICISRQDKEQVIFFNPEHSLGQSEELQAMWHRVSVDGVTEADVEKYLENVGLGAMQGEGRKRKMPGTSSKKTRKKPKLARKMNTHLNNELLKDYSADDEKK